MMSVEKNYKDKVTSNDTQCPSCKNSLETHSNCSLLECIFIQLAKINKKNKTFDLESESQSNETPMAGDVTIG